MIAEIVEDGSLWMNNRSGSVYKVICVANTQATRIGWYETVVYKDLLGAVWCRRRKSWDRAMTLVTDKTRLVKANTYWRDDDSRNPRL